MESKFQQGSLPPFQSIPPSLPSQTQKVAVAKLSPHKSLQTDSTHHHIHSPRTNFALISTMISDSSSSSSSSSSDSDDPLSFTNIFDFDNLLRKRMFDSLEDRLVQQLTTHLLSQAQAQARPGTSNQRQRQQRRPSKPPLKKKRKKQPPPPQQPNWAEKAAQFLSKVRQNSPLIQCITNYVSMDLVANTLLAVGASPCMVHSADEIPDFTPQVDGLYINVGSLFAESLPGMKLAAGFATRYCKPWVLDPVGAGGSGFRLRACLDLVGLKPAVIRGNGSEIIAVSRASTGTSKGADSVHESVDAVEAAKSLAQSSGAIVAVTGAVDIITDGQKVIGVHNGVPMMQTITATGCSVTALIAAFVAVGPAHAFEATVSALSVFGIAGELGMETAKGPASLRVNLIDSLHGLDEASIHRHAKVSPQS